MYLSKQLAQLHPELTMPMFSEITYRFQTARPELRQLLLQYLLPWLYNMELVDPKVPPANPLSYFQYYANEVNRAGTRREGWGSAEATEMVLNNLFYLTAKFSDEHPKEIEELWTTLCSCWPNNLKVIIRYLLIISGMAPQELLSYTKRVVLYLARSRPDRLLDEMMNELQMVETLNCLIERTETPPFYRLTSMRKASSHSDGPSGMAGQNDTGNRNELGVEKGTIHTKRHSGEDPVKTGTSKSDSALRSLSSYSNHRSEKGRTTSGPSIVADDASNQVVSEPQVVIEDGCTVLRNGQGDRFDVPQPHPLPMPEYGGYFAPLTEYLPDCSQPISGFHRCNVAVMLLTDVVVDGVEVDWSIHVPLMLHILFLGLDHTRPLVHEHCKTLLLNLLVVLADHSDHLTVAQILLNSKTKLLGLGLHIPSLPVINHNFTEPDSNFDSYLQGPALPVLVQQPGVGVGGGGPPVVESGNSTVPAIVTSDVILESLSVKPGPDMPIQDVVKSLINFLSYRHNQPLWSYEDITAKVWSIKSAEQLDTFLQHVHRVFRDSLPLAVINERWAQTALQLGLSCSSRHYAGRSLQIFRSLRIAITSRMLSDILSRLVETVAEQGEDMQGYVTELLLTLEAAVDSLESDFRPLDFMKEIFKSTPNLNNKDSMGGKRSLCGNMGLGPLNPNAGREGHTRSTSYSVSYCMRNKPGSPASENKDIRARAHTEIEPRTGCNLKYPTNLSRSRSAQSLKLLGDSSSQDDKMTILAQLFWIAVSLLESDYEHEFLLALRLLSRVLHRLPLDRPDARDKVEKLQAQIRWTSFPGVHALLLKGCTNPNTYEAVVPLLSMFTPLLDLPMVDPTQSLAFPMNVIALLPYMLLNFEDANELCIRSAENIAQASSDKGKKLENLGTVMNLYSRRTFSKESFQWTKCVVKYLYDTYAHLSLNILAFLVEVLEKGPSVMQQPVLSIIHCMLHYIDLASSAAQPINADLLRVIAKYVGGSHWKEALKILKLVVARSSTLVAPTAIHSHMESSSSPHPSFSENEIFTKKELPGPTMEFTFDLSQTPVIGRRFIPRKEEKSNVSPRRSVSLSPADGGNVTGWKRPWMCQGRVRECLVNVLTTCGQRVGLPKSPSVIFSQSSDLMERQSSMASSTEEVSGPNDLSGGSRRDDATQDQFGVFKDFDFLEYESESVEGESTDNFNWGVRRRPLLEGKTDSEVISSAHEESISEDTPVLEKKKRGIVEESSDDEVGSESPLDEVPVASDFVITSVTSNIIYPPSSLALRDRRSSETRSDTSGSSVGDLGDDTPCNASPSLTGHLSFRPVVRDCAEEAWKQQILSLFNHIPTTSTLELFQLLNKLIKDVVGKTIEMTRESCANLTGRDVQLLTSRLTTVCELLSNRADPPHVWFTVDALQEPKFTDALRFGMLEIQQHLETFLDKKEQAAEFVGGIKTSAKLHLLADEEGGETNCSDIILDLGRALYKLHFQLLLLLESAHKMVTSLHTIARMHQLSDISDEVSVVKEALGKAAEEVSYSDRGTPTPTASPSTSPGSIITLDSKLDDEVALMDLVSEGEWAAALKHARLNRNSWQSEPISTGFDDSDDITEILNVYCKVLSRGKSGVFVVTSSETELNELTCKLRENLFQVLGAVTHLENQMKETKEIQRNTDY
uniref:Uncharacterized protein n=1 Tax=Pediculus humanus subsp. corporis TaxID=121224 RepID=A0A1S4MZI1_PEDHC